MANPPTPSAPGQLGTCEWYAIGHWQHEHPKEDDCIRWTRRACPDCGFDQGHTEFCPGFARNDSWRPLDPPEQLGTCTAAGCFGSTPHDPSGHCEGTWRPLDPDERTVGERLVSPNGFDGRGPVPEKVQEAAKTLARLRVKFVNQWNPATENPLTASEVAALFNASMVQAEWIRELYEVIHPDA